jgi:hypothetical protein
MHTSGQHKGSPDFKAAVLAVNGQLRLSLSRITIQNVYYKGMQA